MGFGRHFRLESEVRGSLLGLACLLGVSCFCLTVVRLRAGAQSRILDSADPHNYFGLIPQHYSANYYLTEANFVGNDSQADTNYVAESSMLVTVVHSTQQVVFNSLGLNFTSVAYVLDGWIPVCLCGVEPACLVRSCKGLVQSLGPEGAANGTVALQLLSGVGPGQSLELYFTFVGSLQSGPGLSRSAAFNYTDQDSGTVQSQVLVATSLEPYGARRMLPCLDFPNLKASFSFSVQAPQKLVARSTMGEGFSQPGFEPGTTLHQFATSPKMSTYLIGITVGHMVSSSAMSDSGKTISVWSVPALAEQQAVALQAAVRGTNFYENYTGVVLPLQKIDLMAIPGKSGAVENWGLIQFDERRLLVNQATEGAYGRWLCADVVCHELGHQWFGDYVTCADFSNIAVNEGLASFVEYKCIAAAFPEMSGPALSQLAVSPHGENIGVHEGPRANALASDSTPFVEPLQSNKTPGFLSYHPQIPYSKGAALWRMLEAFWNSDGQDNFKAGLQVLMKRHGQGSATLQDVLLALLEALATSQSGAFQPNVGQTTSLNSMLATLPTDKALILLESWILDPGFPLVNISANGTTAQQSRFLAWGSDASYTSNDTFVTGNSSVWYLPIGTTTLVTPAEEVSASWQEVTNQSWAMVDFQNDGKVFSSAGTGLYRVQYPVEQQQQLIASLRNLSSNQDFASPSLLSANALISDILALSFSDNIDPSATLELAAAVAASPVSQTGFGMYLLVIPVVEALQQLTLLSKALDTEDQCRLDTEAAARQLLGALAQPIIAQITQNDTSTSNEFSSSNYNVSQDTFLFDAAKGKILLAAAFSGYGPAATLLCDLYLNSTGAAGQAIEPDLRGAAYQVAVAGIGTCSADAPRVWQAMLTKWQTDPDIQEAERGLYALPWANSAALLWQTLDNSLQHSPVLSRSPGNNFAAILRNVGRNAANMAEEAETESVNGSLVAWQWVQDTFQGQNASEVLQDLESLQFVPTQQIYDSLNSFLEPIQTTILSDTASKSRLLAKLQHQIQWVQHHLLEPGSNFCQLAKDIAASE